MSWELSYTAPRSHLREFVCGITRSHQFDAKFVERADLPRTYYEHCKKCNCPRSWVHPRTNYVMGSASHDVYSNMVVAHKRALHKAGQPRDPGMSVMR